MKPPTVWTPANLDALRHAYDPYVNLTKQLPKLNAILKTLIGRELSYTGVYDVMIRHGIMKRYCDVWSDAVKVDLEDWIGHVSTKEVTRRLNRKYGKVLGHEYTVDAVQKVSFQMQISFKGNTPDMPLGDMCKTHGVRFDTAGLLVTKHGIRTRSAGKYVFVLEADVAKMEALLAAYAAPPPWPALQIKVAARMAGLNPNTFHSRYVGSGRVREVLCQNIRYVHEDDVRQLIASLTA